MIGDARFVAAKAARDMGIQDDLFFGTYVLQKSRANDAPWRAALKALLAGVVVGAPWPIGGTLVGGWVLLSSGLGDARNEIMRK